MRTNPNNSARVQESDTALGRHVQPEWLGLRRLAEYADVSERTLRGWIHSPLNPLPAVRIGGKILVRRREFDAWLERHKIQSLESLKVDSIVEQVLEGVTG